MKLGTFINAGKKRVAMIVDNYVFDVVEAQRVVNDISTMINIGKGSPFPYTMRTFIEAGDPVWSEARRLEDYLRSFLERGDMLLFENTVMPLDEAAWRTPVPDPPLFWLIGGNSPNALRARHWKDKIADWPVGFLKPVSTLCGHMEPLEIPKHFTMFRWTPEFGVVMGRDAQDVSEEEALDHVFGYTCVNDITAGHFKQNMVAELGSADQLVFEDLMAQSYFGKSVRGFAPTGPWITTKDEVVDPNNLLIYGRQSGVLRDRAHTCAMFHGVERTVSFNSRLMTLRAGTILSLGAMRVDGLCISQPLRGDNEYMEVEIESVGTLRTPIVDHRIVQ